MSEYTRVIRVLAREGICQSGEAIRTIEAMLSDTEQIAHQYGIDWIEEGLRAEHFEARSSELREDVEWLTQCIRNTRRLHSRKARRLRAARGEIRTLRRECAA